MFTVHRFQFTLNLMVTLHPQLLYITNLLGFEVMEWFPNADIKKDKNSKNIFDIWVMVFKPNPYTKCSRILISASFSNALIFLLHSKYQIPSTIMYNVNGKCIV